MAGNQLRPSAAFETANAIHCRSAPLSTAGWSSCRSAGLVAPRRSPEHPLGQHGFSACDPSGPTAARPAERQSITPGVTASCCCIGGQRRHRTGCAPMATNPGNPRAAAGARAPRLSGRRPMYCGESFIWMMLIKAENRMATSLVADQRKTCQSSLPTPLMKLVIAFT